MTNRDEKLHGAFERTVFRKDFGAICVSDEYRRGWDHELFEHFGYRDICSQAHKNLKNPTDGQRKQGRPRLQ